MVLHGDYASLAGWKLSAEAMEPVDARLRESLDCGTGNASCGGSPVGAPTGGTSDGAASGLDRWLDEAEASSPDGDAAALVTTPEAEVAAALAAAKADAFLCTHTCLPFGQALRGGGAVVNNGSAGMRNFCDHPSAGLVTRVGPAGSIPEDSLYGAELVGLGGRRTGLRVDAIPVAVDTAAWAARFRAAWPVGSPAHASYSCRMNFGPSFTLAQAARQGFTLAPGAAL